MQIHEVQERSDRSFAARYPSPIKSQRADKRKTKFEDRSVDSGGSRRRSPIHLRAYTGTPVGRARTGPSASGRMVVRCGAALVRCPFSIPIDYASTSRFAANCPGKLTGGQRIQEGFRGKSTAGRQLDLFDGLAGPEVDRQRLRRDVVRSSRGLTCTPRESRILRRLARPLQERLRIERQLAHPALLATAFDAVLEAVPSGQSSNRAGGHRATALEAHHAPSSRARARGGRRHQQGDRERSPASRPRSKTTSPSCFVVRARELGRALGWATHYVD